MKKKIIIILSITLMLIFTSGITYSVFYSEANLATPNQQVAKFIFNAEKINNIDLNLTNMIPGENHDYLFSVTNTEEELTSNVDINYQIIVKTYHFIPFKIELFKTVDDNEVIVGVCDENHSRNELNELVCNMQIENINHEKKEIIDYRLNLEFPQEYSDESYSGLVDFLNIELKSWQVIKEGA